MINHLRRKNVLRENNTSKPGMRNEVGDTSEINRIANLKDQNFYQEDEQIYNRKRQQEIDKHRQLDQYDHQRAENK